MFRPGGNVDDDVAQWAEVFALLGDQARLELLLHLRDAGPLTVGAMAEGMCRSPSAVSQSLRLLRAHGVVHAERAGRNVVYSLREHAVTCLLTGLLAGAHSPGRRPAPAPATT
jgi:DNA-binding transcriptional ArsR family regulator